MDEIIKAVCRAYAISKEDLLSKSRKKTIATARQMVFYLSRKLTSLSLQDIGRRLNRYHATVLHGIAKVKRDREAILIAKHLTKRIVGIDADPT